MSAGTVLANSAVQTQLCKLCLKPSFMGDSIEPLLFNRSVYCGFALWFEPWMNTILPKCRFYRRSSKDGEGAGQREDWLYKIANGMTPQKEKAKHWASLFIGRESGAYSPCSTPARLSRNCASIGTGRPVEPLLAPLFQAVPATSRWAQ